MPTISLPNRAARKAGELAEQGAFDFLMPFSERRTLLSIGEVAKVLARSRDFVESMVDEGRLEVFAPALDRGAADGADRQIQRKRITRRSVLVLLAEQAQSDPAHWFERVLRVVDTCTAEQLTALIVHATQRRSRL